MKTRSEEPLVAINLKGLAILSAVVAGAVYLSMFRDGVPPDASPRLIAQAAADLATKQVVAFTLTGAAIMMWWMGEIVSLLAKIAANGAAAQVAAPGKETHGKPVPAKEGTPKLAAVEEDGVYRL